MVIHNKIDDPLKITLPSDISLIQIKDKESVWKTRPLLLKIIGMIQWQVDATLIGDEDAGKEGGIEKIIMDGIKNI